MYKKWNFEVLLQLVTVCLPQTYPKLLERTDGDRISMLPSVPALSNNRVDSATFLDFPGKFILNEMCWEY